MLLVAMKFGVITALLMQVEGDVTYNGHNFDEFVVQRTAAYVDQVLLQPSDWISLTNLMILVAHFGMQKFHRSSVSRAIDLVCGSLRW